MWGSDAVTVPERTSIHVTLDQTVASSEKPGHHFRATVSQPVKIDGKTVIPKGARAEGVIVEAKEAGLIKGRARLEPSANEAVFAGIPEVERQRNKEGRGVAMIIDVDLVNGFGGSGPINQAR